MSAEGTAASVRVGSFPARVVFFGSGGFAVPILEALLDLPDARVVGVVTAPDRPVGRRAVLTPTPVAARARDLRVALLQPVRVRAPEAISAISALGPMLGVLADYGQLVPETLLEVPPLGILNVHPSLLPRHRGATPIPATILAGDAVAGVTAFRMDAGLDTGPVVAASSWPLRGTETAPELEAAAGRAGADLIARVVPAWLRGELAARPQAGSGATLTRPFRREDGRLDPGRPAVELERMIRALQPWPGTFLDTASERIAVLEAAVGEGSRGDEPGRLIEDGPGLALATVDGRLRLVRVRPAGGRAMAIADFRRGAGRGLVGSRIEGASRL